MPMRGGYLGMGRVRCDAVRGDKREVGDDLGLRVAHRPPRGRRRSSRAQPRPPSRRDSSSTPHAAIGGRLHQLRLGQGVELVASSRRAWTTRSLLAVGSERIERSKLLSPPAEDRRAPSVVDALTPQVHRKTLRDHQGSEASASRNAARARVRPKEKPMPARATPPPGVEDRVRARIEQGAARLLNPPRTALFIAVGSAVLLARGLRSVLGWAVDVRERQLELFNGSLGRVASRFWSRAAHAKRPGP